jgi:hypothetical protein
MRYQISILRINIDDQGCAGKAFEVDNALLRQCSAPTRRRCTAQNRANRMDYGKHGQPQAPDRLN